MNYNTSNNNYLGHGVDGANHHLDAFQIDNEIHLVYNIGESNQIVSSRNIDTIQKNMDDYLWTPYSIFIGKIKDNNEI